MQQPKAAEDWGRIVCPELGQVQLSRAKENWGRVVRPKLSQSPTKRETAAQGKLPVDSYACMLQVLRELLRPRICKSKFKSGLCTELIASSLTFVSGFDVTGKMI